MRAKKTFIRKKGWAISAFNNISATLRQIRTSGFPTRSDTNPAIQPQKAARGLKFRILEVERLCYLCSENKGHRSPHRWSASLFTHKQKAGFLMTWLICYGFKNQKLSVDGNRCVLKPFKLWPYLNTNPLWR